jgi:hypothetical protein
MAARRPVFRLAALRRGSLSGPVGSRLADAPFAPFAGVGVVMASAPAGAVLAEAGGAPWPAVSAGTAAAP